MEDYLVYVDDGQLTNIFEKLGSPEDLASAYKVCRRWRDAGVEGRVWKQLCLNISPPSAGIFSRITKAEDEREDSDLPCKNNLWLGHSVNGNIFAESKVFCQLAWELTKPVVSRNQIIRAVKASSTDNYPEEAIEKTLEPLPKWPSVNSPSYWSSAGKPDPKEPETLTYELEAPVCVVHEVWVRPFQAYFQYGEPIYSSKEVKFRFGFKAPNTAAEEFVWTYESPPFPMAKVDALQRFVLPHPVLCIGGIFQVEFVDRVQAQEFDGLFYICICHVRAIGRQLPHFEYSLNDDERTVTLRLKEVSTAITHVEYA